jgi:imidazoleglycerol-phosphate dehydratase
MRIGTCDRKTGETDVKLALNIDAPAKASIDTGVGFLDHMLTLFATHGIMDLSVAAMGDIHVDAHHVTEDIGICLGLAVRDALGNARGIVRYASGVYPMDDALVQVAIDVSGRPYFAFSPSLPKAKIGQFDAELVEEFFRAFAFNAKLNLHIRILAGDNLHHLAEACFKGVGISLGLALRSDPRREGSVPSTKGVI